MNNTTTSVASSASLDPSGEPKLIASSHSDLRPDRHAEKAEDLRLRQQNWIFGECHSLDDLPASAHAELDAEYGFLGQP